MKQEAEVFAAYETNLILSTLEDQTQGYSLSTSNSFTIDNSGNTREYPIITITSADSYVSEVSIAGNSILLDETLSGADLILDFKNQEYTYNGASILDNVSFSGDDRPHLVENAVNTVEITYTNSIDVIVEYTQYEELKEPKFVQDFRISKDISFRSDRKFKKLNKERLIEDSKNYNVTLSNLAYDWEIGDAIDNNKTFRIDYTEDHTNGDKTYNKSIVGIKFGTYERYYRDSTAILIDSLTGEGINIY